MRRSGGTTERFGRHTKWHTVRLEGHGGAPVDLSIWERPGEIKITITGGYRERPMDAFVTALLNPVNGESDLPVKPT